MEAMHKKWYQNPEMIVGLSALIVSLVAVFVGVYSASIDRAYARASVWPRLEIYRNYTQKKEDGKEAGSLLQYGVNNNGTGPAIIKYAKVTLDGKAVKNWADLMKAVAGNANQLNQSQINGRTLPAQQSITAFGTENQPFIKAWFGNEAKRLTIDLCYCSIYDECWATDIANKPKPIPACPSTADAFEQ
ncbi:hypothetical protein PVT67_13015 [Gallaecimonas kandeliae]|uniref:hypothetical protein n=1 Tax=Gallaecimonas kandeliae TaxID=3029055 RepID=UPI0026479D02|nr:hypothetical protein [Gallaecimonas kandeliae]WKE64583.1 hypothetical protein PVT67_13015 [Gallaecimonas kandeliae]